MHIYEDGVNHTRVKESDVGFFFYRKIPNEHHRLLWIKESMNFMHYYYYYCKYGYTYHAYLLVFFLLHSFICVAHSWHHKPCCMWSLWRNVSVVPGAVWGIHESVRVLFVLRA